jgi:hypothetical protein
VGQVIPPKGAITQKPRGHENRARDAALDQFGDSRRHGSPVSIIESDRRHRSLRRHGARLAQRVERHYVVRLTKKIELPPKPAERNVK